MEVTSTPSSTTEISDAVDQERFNTSGAARFLLCSEGYLRKARRGKTSVSGPPFRRIAGRCIYEREALDEWASSHPVES